MDGEECVDLFINLGVSLAYVDPACERIAKYGATGRLLRANAEQLLAQLLCPRNDIQRTSRAHTPQAWN